MLNKLFLWIALTIGFSSLFYLNEEANAQQVPNIIFKITNASAESSDNYKFLLNITNMTTNKQICKSGDCLIQIIKFDDMGLSTATVSLPTPGIQNMHSGVDFRLHDTAYNNMSEIKREFQERWSVWGNCEIGEIEETVFVCGHDTYDTITLSNKLQDIELMLPLVYGKYDPESDIMEFAANFQ